jgi:hypothetical protein
MLLAQLPHRRRYWCDHRALVVHARRDLALTIVAVLLSVSSVQLMARKALAYRGVTAGEQAPLVGQINPVDRMVAGRWDTAAKRSGRVFKTTAMYLVPAALLLGAGSVRRRLVLLWVYVQGSVITDSVTGITKGLVDRLRPFAYVDNATMLSLDPDSRSDLLEDLASPDVYKCVLLRRREHYGLRSAVLRAGVSAIHRRHAPEGARAGACADRRGVGDLVPHPVRQTLPERCAGWRRCGTERRLERGTFA